MSWQEAQQSRADGCRLTSGSVMTRTSGAVASKYTFWDMVHSCAARSSKHRCGQGWGTQVPAAAPAAGIRLLRAQRRGGSCAWQQLHVECRQDGPGVHTWDTTSTSTVSIVLLLSAGTRAQRGPRQNSGATPAQRRHHTATAHAAHQHHQQPGQASEAAARCRAGRAPGEGVLCPACRKRRPPPQLARRLAVAAEAGPTACSSTASSRAAAQAARRGCRRCIKV